jgi:hypothetical protein
MSKDLRNTIIAVAVFIVLAGLMLYFVNDTQTELDQVLEQNKSLEDQINGFKKEVEDGKKLVPIEKELEANFKEYVKILPSEEVATQERLLKIIQNYAELANVRLQEYAQDRVAGGGGRGAGEFKELGLSFRLTGDFDAFVKFVNLLERHEQFLKVNNFAVTPTKVTIVDATKEIVDLSVTLGVTTYAYVPKKK